MIKINYVLSLINTLLLVTGQILIKIGLDKNGGIKISSFWSIFFIPDIFFGLLLYVLATFVWFIILSRMNLSVAYPMQSLSYVFGIFAASLVFKETITMSKWIGIIFIVIGVIFIANKSGN